MKIIYSFLSLQAIVCYLFFSLTLRASEEISMDPKSEFPVCSLCSLSDDIENSLSGKQFKICSQNHALCLECFEKIVNKEKCPFCRLALSSNPNEDQEIQIRSSAIERLETQRQIRDIQAGDAMNYGCQRIMILSGGVCCFWYAILFFCLLKIHKDPQDDDQDNI